MKYISISLTFIFCLCISLNAQTGSEFNQAKADYKNREFDKALPVFEREYNVKPANASLNLWYGVCLIETGGDLKKAEECLLVASKKNLQESYLYLGDLYVKEYRVSEASQYYERYAKARPKEKETTLKDRNESLAKMERLISRTENVQIIDSLIVDKAQFLSAYKLSADAGSLTPFNETFNTSHAVESAVYANGKGTKIYFGQPLEGRYFLSTMDKLLNGFGNEKLLSDNNFGLTGDTNYPYVLTDGTTVYFAGKDQNGMGNYDIYVTRYNLNTNTYLTPEILNMPFNSPANDYMMVVDEIKGIGWFATDRFQPEGKVCVYTFIPNDEISLVDIDDERQRENRARLTSIKDTWKAGQNYSQLIATARKGVTKAVERTNDFTFVVDDTHVYHTLRDFKSASARNMYADFSNRKKELEAAEKELKGLRDEYAKAASEKKQSLSGRILNLENKQSQLYEEVISKETLTRNEEIKTLK